MQKIRGFTLIEILIVIAMLGVLASLAVINLGPARKTAHDTKRKTELKQYQNSLEIYASKNSGKYPTSSTTIRTGSAFCTTISVNPCPEDTRSPTFDYMYQPNASGTDYVLWVDLEKDTITGGDNYFVVCSNGQTGIALSGDMPPTGGACPTLQ